MLYRYRGGDDKLDERQYGMNAPISSSSLGLFWDHALVNSLVGSERRHIHRQAGDLEHP